MLRALGTLLLLTTACGRPDAAPSVAEILADPARYHEQLLEVQGEASNGSGVFSLGVYDLNDGTGSITVVTSAGLPSDGSVFRVRGEVSTGVTVAGRRFGVALYEKERLYEDLPSGE